MMAWPKVRVKKRAALVALLVGPTVALADDAAPQPFAFHVQFTDLTQYHPANDGANIVAHGIKINDGFVLGGPIGLTLAAGQNAGVFVALYNMGGADRLVSAAAPGTAASVQLPPGGIPLPSTQDVYLTGPVPRIVLTSLTHPLPSGGTVPLILHFMNAGNVKVALPVFPSRRFRHS